MEKKIIFFDIDGTLFHEQKHIIPESTIQAMKKAQDNGHLCVINTGRTLSIIENTLKEFPFDAYICGCGTYIEYHNKTIFHTELDEKLRKEIIQKVFECHVDAVLEGRHNVYFKENGFDNEVADFKQRYINQGFPVHDYNQDSVVVFDKLAVWYDSRSDIDTFKQFLTPYFDIIQRADNFIEIVPIGYSKASGIQMLADYLNISIDHTISIGDSTNDLPMLTYTKESVAMGNSNPILFDKVTYITDDIDHDGIYNALKHFEII